MAVRTWYRFVLQMTMALDIFDAEPVDFKFPAVSLWGRPFHLPLCSGRNVALRYVKEMDNEALFLTMVWYKSSWWMSLRPEVMVPTMFYASKFLWNSSRRLFWIKFYVFDYHSCISLINIFLKCFFFQEHNFADFATVNIFYKS